MRNIRKRDILAFILGVFTLFTFEVVYDWENNVQAFKDGWNSVECNQDHELD